MIDGIYLCKCSVRVRNLELGGSAGAYGERVQLGRASL